MKHELLFGLTGALLLAPGLATATSGLPGGDHHHITITSHEGDDDLLSAGLGKTGLASAVAPAIANPLAPTAAELRRLNIWANYRALIDTTSNGGYGRLFGPNIDLDGNDTLGEGLIPGTEYRTSQNVRGVKSVTLLVQVPEHFDPEQPCIVAAPSSGSRGVYGAIGTTGEWALKRGCAVAYTDKGTGAGGHELDTNTVTLPDGTLADARDARRSALFRAEISEPARQAYIAQHPNRYAMKHAHSQDNPERAWGEATLAGIEFAFDVLNRYHQPERGKHRRGKHAGYRPHNTLVIAASVSNGGGAVIAAAEADRRGLIDAVVAQEPQINVDMRRGVTVKRGGTPVPASGLPLYDYTTYANLVQPCAALAPSVADSPFVSFVVPAFGANRCAALAAAGEISGNTLIEQAENALAKLQAHGWEADSNLLHASHFGFAVSTAVSLTYANAFMRAPVTANLCGYSMGTTDAAGLPAAPAASPMPTLWSLNNGVPPSTGINLIAEDAANGPIREALAVSTSTGLADYYWDGARCLRELLDEKRVRHSIAQTEVNGRLHGKPTLIVHGRADALVPVNHTSRPYLGLNNLAEGKRSQLSYIEVTNAQHFEAFLPFPGYDSRFIPLHYYGGVALDLMWKHLTEGAALPPSQIVRTVPRGGSPGAAPAITLGNLPPIQMHPAAADRIAVSHGTVMIPN
ncbi:3-hydroxybutyrate oligomer hydrolase family protein [Denitromonas sp.]|uniref:3-hydroxybutyrate oligomer hydrolase family protein n=1 Tax=Denitromonas sp. TaxID=2734609 RepID=UPI003A8A8B1D